jgi:threonine/homoserine/homoserine lactone efflux protein
VYRQGLLNNLANPKMAAFFVSLLPQFVPAHAALAGLLALALLFCRPTFGWLVAYSVLMAALIAFGVRLAHADHGP